MHQIQITFNVGTIYEDFERLGSDVTIIEERGFNGETIVELFVSALPALTILATILVEKIKTKKISKLIIDGERIEVENVSEKIISDLLEKKLLESKAIDKET